MQFTHTLWSAFALSIAITCTAAFADDVTAQGEPYTFRDEPTSQPAAGGPSVEGGLVEYLADRFSPHEPIYFLYGPDDPHVKFQISLKYQIFSPQGALQKAVPTVSGLYFAYTQQSFWDTGADSGPFFDSSYKPEFLWLTQFRKPDWIPGPVALRPSGRPSARVQRQGRRRFAQPQHRLHPPDLHLRRLGARARLLHDLRPAYLELRRQPRRQPRPGQLPRLRRRAADHGLAL
jgi:hypothetical protein